MYYDTKMFSIRLPTNFGELVENKINLDEDVGYANKNLTHKNSEYLVSDNVGALFENNTLGTISILLYENSSG